MAGRHGSIWGREYFRLLILQEVWDPNWLGHNRLDSSEPSWQNGNRDRSSLFREVHQVTVCIAAECEYKDMAALVMVCDWQGTKGTFIKSDSVDKIRQIGTGTVLLAGNLSDADELVFACDSGIRLFSGKDDEADMHQYLEALRAATAKVKAARVKHFIEMSLGISGDDFWKNGRQYLSVVQQDEILKEIREIDLGASLLIGSTYGNKDANIVRVDRTGRVTWEDTFSTIGTGGPIAEAFLHQFDWDEQIGMEECLYRVFSAKVAAEKNPNVGPTTSFEILRGGKRYDLTDEAFKELKKKVQPSKSRYLRLPDDFLVEIPDEGSTDAVLSSQ